MKRVLVLSIVISLMILAGCAQQSTEKAQTSTPSQQAAAPQSGTASGKIDIVAMGITASSPSWTAGDRVTLYPVIKNLNGPINGVKVGLYANGGLIKMYNLDFKEGETKGPLYEWYPKNSGTYEIKIIADPDNLLKETNEGNNEATTGIEVS